MCCLCLREGTRQAVVLQGSVGMHLCQHSAVLRWFDDDVVVPQWHSSCGAQEKKSLRVVQKPGDYNGFYLCEQKCEGDVCTLSQRGLLLSCRVPACQGDLLTSDIKRAKLAKQTASHGGQFHFVVYQYYNTADGL